MEGMTQVSVESTDAKSLLPGYITVVVMTAWAKSSGITEGACFAIPLPFANLPSHYKKILVIMSVPFSFCVSLHTLESGQHLTISSVNIYCGLFEL